MPTLKTEILGSLIEINYEESEKDKLRNIIEKFPLIPVEVISKHPSAELRPDQKDEDSLPPYDILDQILKELIEEEKSISEIVEIGFEKELVKKIYRLVLLSEYKRRQSPPGVKLTGRSFGKERRYPGTNAYYEE